MLFSFLRPSAAPPCVSSRSARLGRETHRSPWDQAILFALADSAPAEAFPRLGPLLFAANARFGAQGREWMRAALASEHFPSGAAHVDAQAREHFLSGNAHLELNSRRYQAMMNDFAQICRRQNTADALLAYQIA